MQAAGGHGAQERAAQDVVVRGAIAPQDLRQRGRCAVELHGDDASEREVHAVRAPRSSTSSSVPVDDAR